jgi:hypothetical protein
VKSAILFLSFISANYEIVQSKSDSGMAIAKAHVSKGKNLAPGGMLLSTSE